jgi:hypothetical protein
MIGQDVAGSGRAVTAAHVGSCPYRHHRRTLALFTRSARAIALLVLAVVLGAPDSATARDDLWRLLSDGRHVALIRHAQAPGTGDPAGFSLTDCATQRNLDMTGRAQARRLGQRFRAAGIVRADLHTSQWCRCVETAQLMELGEPRIAPEALNSFFGHPDREPQARQALLRLAGIPMRDGLPMILVTHQVNITAVTGIVPASGEIIVVRREDDGSLGLVGRIAPD